MTIVCPICKWRTCISEAGKDALDRRCGRCGLRPWLIPDDQLYMVDAIDWKRRSKSE